MLTKDEIALCEQLGDEWNAFLRLERMHPDELDDFRFHIHALQQILMSRAAQRDHPDVFRQPDQLTPEKPSA